MKLLQHQKHVDVIHHINKLEEINFMIISTDTNYNLIKLITVIFIFTFLFIFLFLHFFGFIEVTLVDKTIKV